MHLSCFRRGTHLVVVLIVLIMVGCGRNKGLVEVKNLQNIAIVQISSAETVAWSDPEKQESTGATIQSKAKLIGGLVKGKTISEAVTEAEHNAQKALDESIPIILENIKEVNVFPVLDEELVTENDVYRNAEVNPYVSDVITGHGFILPNLRNAAVCSQLCKEFNAEALLVITIEFKKDIYTGVGSSGSAKAIANVQFALKDAQGETVWWDHKTEYSHNDVPMISGAYNYDRMDELCVEAAGAASKELLLRLKANLDKI